LQNAEWMAKCEDLELKRRPAPKGGEVRSRKRTIGARRGIEGKTTTPSLSIKSEFASHNRPWRDCSNAERLDGENGLLLTPSIDHLFDRGFIGFEGDGNLIISPVAHRPSLEKMGIDMRGAVNVGAFTAGQRDFLEYHRDMVLLKRAR
jgi:hypothetical protein